MVEQQTRQEIEKIFEEWDAFYLYIMQEASLDEYSAQGLERAISYNTTLGLEDDAQKFDVLEYLQRNIVEKSRIENRVRKNLNEVIVTHLKKVMVSIESFEQLCATTDNLSTNIYSQSFEQLYAATEQLSAYFYSTDLSYYSEGVINIQSIIEKSTEYEVRLLMISILDAIRTSFKENLDFLTEKNAYSLEDALLAISSILGEIFEFVPLDLEDTEEQNPDGFENDAVTKQ